MDKPVIVVRQPALDVFEAYFTNRPDFPVTADTREAAVYKLLSLYGFLGNIMLIDVSI